MEGPQNFSELTIVWRCVHALQARTQQPHPLAGTYVARTRVAANPGFAVGAPISYSLPLQGESASMALGTTCQCTDRPQPYPHVSNMSHC